MKSVISVTAVKSKLSNLILHFEISFIVVTEA